MAFWSLVFLADVDGFKLLEQIGLELDVPVISKYQLCLQVCISRL